MKLIQKLLLVAILAAVSPGLFAAEYKIDTKGTHAFIQFRIKHLGYSWLYGRFNQFDGSFTWDEKKPEASSVSVTIDMNSLDSNHVERDKHLKDDRFFDVANHPTASFESTSFKMTDDTHGVLEGILTLRGVSKAVTIDVQKIGGGPDPWGGYRVGFTGSTIITLADFGMTFNLGPASTTAEVLLDIEGIKQ